jgi:hypothetical protein
MSVLKHARYNRVEALSLGWTARSTSDRHSSRASRE